MNVKNSFNEIVQWREREFPWLLSSRETSSPLYLDHAGAPLFPQSLLHSVTNDLLLRLPQNPHSSKEQVYNINLIREAALRFFGASPENFSLIWTSGATAALKLLGEQFRWKRGSVFGYSSNNHTSAVGLREYAIAKGAEVFTFSASEGLECREYGLNLNSIAYIISRIRDYKFLSKKGAALSGTELSMNNRPQDISVNISPTGPHLLVVTGESNFDGTRMDLLKLAKLRKPFSDTNYLNYYVVLDAAKLAGSEPINLDSLDIDFVVVSFYKIFGYPTGLGALIIRHSALPLLLGSDAEVQYQEGRSYFGGGSVDLWSPMSDFVIPAILSLTRCFEFGFNTDESTLKYPQSYIVTHESIHLLAERCRQQFEVLSSNVKELTTYLIRRLHSLRYRATGKPCVAILGDPQKTKPKVWRKANNENDHEKLDMSPVVAFVCLSISGEVISYPLVKRVADKHRVYLRTGCFCNVGGCIEGLGLTDMDIRLMHKSGHVCGNEIGMFGNLPTGCIRISLGTYHLKKDIDRFISFLKRHVLYSDSLSLHLRPPMFSRDAKITQILRKQSIAMEEEFIVQTSDDNEIKQSLNPKGIFKEKYMRKMRFPQVESVWIYPVKGCRGIRLRNWVVTEANRGLLWDRIFKLDASPASENATLDMTSKVRRHLVEMVTGLLFVMSKKPKTDVHEKAISIDSVYVIIFPTSTRKDKPPLLMKLPIDGPSELSTGKTTSLLYLLNSQLFLTRVLLPAQRDLVTFRSDQFETQSNSIYRQIPSARKNSAIEIKASANFDPQQVSSKESTICWLNSCASQFALSLSTTRFKAGSGKTNNEELFDSTFWTVWDEDFCVLEPRLIIGESCNLGAKNKIVNEWCSSIVGRNVILNSTYSNCNSINSDAKNVMLEQTKNKSFSNSHQLMIANRSTFDEFIGSVGIQINIERFRPNLVISGPEANVERSWTKLTLVDYLTGLPSATVGVTMPCYRCSAINVFRKPEHVANKATASNEDKNLEQTTTMLEKSSSQQLSESPSVYSLLASRAAALEPQRQESQRPIFGMLGDISSTCGSMAVIGRGWAVK